MRFPEFSEFTFGYAFTDNLVNRVLADVKGVPIFPSLTEEGRPAGGYDVQIPRYSVPLFLQFKLPQLVKRHRNVWTHGLTAPYYRMHLMRRSHSPQHAALLQHASQGNLVFYVAPEFESRNELNNLYQSGKVPRGSAYVRPEDIGPLSDDDPHHVAYKAGDSTAWFCSQPRRLASDPRSEFFIAKIRGAVRAAVEVGNRAQFFEKTALSVIISAMRDEPTHPATATLPHMDRVDLEWERLAAFRSRLGPGRFAAFVSQLYLDSQLVILGRDA